MQPFSPTTDHRMLDGVIALLAVILVVLAVAVSSGVVADVGPFAPNADATTERSADPDARPRMEGDAERESGDEGDVPGAPVPPPSSAPPETAPPVELEQLPAGCASAERCRLGNESVGIATGPGAGVEITDTGAARLSGMVEISTAGGPVELPNADVEVELDGDGNIVSIEGQADVPLPATGVFSAAAIVDGARAEVGYDWGANLTDLGAYLQPDRRYYYFTFEDSFSLRTGFDELFGDVDGLPLSLSAPGDRSVTIVLDPTDPYFYIGGACPDFGSDDRQTQQAPGPAELEVGGDPGEDCGLGVSAGGFIPFEAQVATGAPGDLGAFGGHIVVHAADIPIQSGVSVDGELVARVEADRLSLGANGDVFASVPLVDDVLDLRFPLGGASAALQVGGSMSEVDLFVAGEFTDDANDHLPDWLPIELPAGNRISASARLVYRPFGPRLLGDESFVDIGGELNVGGSFLTSLTGATPQPIQTSEANLRIDRSGVRLRGRTATRILPVIDVGSDLALDAYIAPASLRESFVELRGSIGVADVALGADAQIRLDGTGIRAGGVVELSPNNRVAVQGMITSREVSLAGDLVVSVGTSDILGFLDGVGREAGEARAEIARLDGEIDRQRAIVIDEREATLAELRQELFDAEGALRTVTDGISDTQRTIDRLEDDLDDAVDEIAEFLIEALVPEFLRDDVKRFRQQIDDAEDELDDLLDERTRLSRAVDAAERALADYEDEIARIAVDVDPRVAILIAERVALIAVAEGAEFFDDILTFDARVQADLSVTIGTSGIAGSVTGSVCSASGCLDLVGGSVTFLPAPELCFTAGPTGGCLRL